jgi:hypothetical protein
MIRQLCEKAPEVAQTFVTTIREFSNGDVPQHEPAGPGNVTKQSVKSKRVPAKDLSYRPSAKRKTGKTNCPADLGQPGDEGKIGIDYPDGVQCSVSNAEGITAQGGSVGISAEVPGDDINIPRECLTQDPKREDTADGRDTSKIAVDKNKEGSIGPAEATSASNEAKQPNVSSKPMPHIVTSPSAPADMTPVTPIKQMEGALASPLTEEIHRGKIPMSLESVSLSPKFITGSSSTEAAPLMDTIFEAAQIIQQFSKYPHGVPKGVHARVIQTFRKDHQEVIGTSNFNQWSDGSMWIEVLEMGSSANRRVTILNMLEYMGAWEWYDRQVEISLETTFTKKNKPVKRRGAATNVLNSMQDLRTDTETPGKWISGIGRVALGKGGDGSDLPPESCDIGIIKRSERLRKKHISMQLSRGQKLSKLVKELGLGILFNPNIW